MLLLLLAISNSLNAQILSNGDFESGGSGVCFLVTDYTLINPLTEACDGLNHTLSAEEFNASNSSCQWYNLSNNLIGSSASVVVSAAGTYKLVVTQNGCSSEEISNVISLFCSIKNGISPNNDGLNDNFDLAF